MYIKQERTL